MIGRAARKAAAACPPPELLQALRAGVLPAEIESRVARHLDRCVVCQALRDALDGEAIESLTPQECERILQRVRAHAPERGHRFLRTHVWQMSAAAAALVMVAAGFALVWQSRRTPPVAVTQPPPAAAPRGPASALRFEMPPFRPLPVLPLRGASPVSAETSELARALEPARANNYNEVSQRLAVFVRRYPRNAAAHFYLGLSHMPGYRDTEAIAALEAAERLAGDDMSLRYDVAWYLALAYRRAGRVEHAQARLDAVCSSGGARSARACAGLNELAVRYVLSGRVTAAGGAPVAGARVGEYIGRMDAEYAVGFTTGFAGVTDVDGRFAISGVPIGSAGSVTVRASRPGYFSEFKVIPAADEMHAAFVLQPWAHVPLGETVRGTIEASEACYGHPGEPCRRYALTVPSDGTLDVSVASAVRSDFDLHVETPSGEVLGPLMSAPLRIVTRASAGSTFEIRILRYGSGAASFELTTRLR